MPSLSENYVKTGEYAFPHLRKKMELSALIVQTVALGSSMLCFHIIYVGNTKEEVKLGVRNDLKPGSIIA